MRIRLSSPVPVAGATGVNALNEAAGLANVQDNPLDGRRR